MPSFLSSCRSSSCSLLQSYGKGTLIFLLGVLLISGFNSVSWGTQLNTLTRQRRSTPYIFLGQQFSGLNEILAGESTIGYYTDRSLDDHLTAMRFAQAQYVLAPLLLDHNAVTHPFTLFAASSPREAVKLVQQTGMVPVKANAFGIILARQPQKGPDVP